MSQEVWEIIIGVAGLILGWLARHKGIGPGPNPIPPPSPNPVPAPAPLPKPDIALIFALLWELLRSRFPSLPPLSPNQSPSAEHVTALAKAMTEKSSQ